MNSLRSLGIAFMVEPMPVDELYVLWAAMQAMVNDIHAPQDRLTDKQWHLAEMMLKRLDSEVNQRLERPR